MLNPHPPPPLQNENGTVLWWEKSWAEGVAQWPVLEREKARNCTRIWLFGVWSADDAARVEKDEAEEAENAEVPRGE